MNKKILLGSLLALTLLLLMPSIPAIQQKIVHEDAFNDLIEQFTIKDEKDKKNMERIKHQLLYTLVIFIAKFRWLRCQILGPISCDWTNWPWGSELEIHNLILFVRCLWLVATLELWFLFWNNLSDTYGWNWDIPI